MIVELVHNIDSNQKILTTWELKVKAKTTVVDQIVQLEQFINKNNLASICNFTNFMPWNEYHTVDSLTAELILIAHSRWDSLANICQSILDISPRVSKKTFLYLAINKYLLHDDIADNSLSDNYDHAIAEVVIKMLPMFDLMEYQYHDLESGNVGNFIVPDNRFILCKNN